MYSSMSRPPIGREVVCVLVYEQPSNRQGSSVCTGIVQIELNISVDLVPVTQLPTPQNERKTGVDQGSANVEVFCCCFRETILTAVSRELFGWSHPQHLSSWGWIGAAVDIKAAN